MSMRDMEVISMYMESISGGTNPGAAAQRAAWQQASKAAGRVSDRPSSKTQASSDLTSSKVTGSNAEASKVSGTAFAKAFDKSPSKVTAPKASDNMTDKKESTDGVMGVQASGEADGPLTLTIQADKKQLLDDQKNVNMEKLKKIMEQMRDSIPNADAKFGIHEKTNRIMIKLVDKDTQKVIKEFPPEKSLDMLAKTLALAGVLVDQRL